MNKNSFVSASILAAWGLLPLAVNAVPNPKLSPATVSGWGIDDWNTSTLKSSPASSVDANGNNVPGIFQGACPWITTAMTGAFGQPYNPNTNPGGQWQWAAGAFAGEANDLTVTDYKPWVVTPITTVNGFNLDYSGTIFNKNFPNAYVAQAQDAGGATFGLNYTRQAGDPQSMVFIQALQDITMPPNAPSTTTYKLDNTPGSGLPQYGGASSYNNAVGGVSKMADGPFRSEQDPATEDYSYDIEFQTVLASFTAAGPNGGNFYTLYPYAEAWGFTYVNTDVVPEPSTYIAAVLMLVPCGTSAWRRLRSSRKAA